MSEPLSEKVIEERTKVAEAGRLYIIKEADANQWPLGSIDNDPVFVDAKLQAIMQVLMETLDIPENVINMYLQEGVTRALKDRFEIIKQQTTAQKIVKAQPGQPILGPDGKPIRL